MLLKTTRDGVKKAFGYFSRLPFSKSLLHRLSEIARGKCVAFFSISRILDDGEELKSHPHFMNKSALTRAQSQKLLTQIKKTLPFVSMSDALKFLRGEQAFQSSVAVLILETPYRMSLKNIAPIVTELEIPLSLAVCPHSLKTGEPPWTDEVFYRVLTTTKEELVPNFMDRAFKLSTSADRLLAANHLTDNLIHCSSRLFTARLTSLRAMLHETALLPRSERIASLPELFKFAEAQKASLLMSGQNLAAIFEQNPAEAHLSLMTAKEELLSMVGESLLPVFFYPLSLTKYRRQELSKLMLFGGFEAAISNSTGLARPGDNMFRLPCLPLNCESPGFSQFELQGVADAIDEFLLVTLAKNEEL